MAHELFGNRFLSNRVPAWHRLGLVTEEPLSARAGLEAVGMYTVERQPVYIQAADGSFQPIPFRALHRPETDDAGAETWSVVTEDYALISPAEFCDMWDEHVAQPVETLGALRSGRQLFITTKLPSFAVAGDEMENYLLALNGMDGAHGAQVVISPVRVVCANTLRLSQELASETYVIQHNQTARARLTEWMRFCYETAAAKTAVIKEACELLAHTPVDKTALTHVLTVAYPDPRPIGTNLPPSVVERKTVDYEYWKKNMAQRREAAASLFQGDGVGMDSPAAKGTLWGLYNAVIETEDYRRVSNGGDNAAAQSALIGERGQVKTRAFNACLALAN